MGELALAKRYRTNPVEITIFCVVLLVFCNSIYRLFNDSRTLHASVLRPMASSPISEGRSPSSVSPAFINIEIKCEGVLDQDTSASKVRLSGPLCGSDPVTAGSSLMKTVVMNGSNKFSATIFTDVNSGKFSTDYIPLNSGKNTIHLEFSYRDGKIASQDITVTKY
jgi:hypothetical protein